MGLRPTIAVMATIHALAYLPMFWSPVHGLHDMPARRDEDPRADVSAS